MPGWDITDGEIRYRVRSPDAFTAGTFFTKEFQKSPKIYAVLGKIKGEEKNTVQSVRFSKEDWTEEKAKNWYEEHEKQITKDEPEPETTTMEFEEIGKSTEQNETDIGFFEKSNLILQSVVFSKKEFTEKSVQDWLAAKSLDVSGVKKNDNGYSIEVRPEKNFLDGSLRDVVLRQGLIATVGLLKKEFQKNIEKKVPDRFALKSENIYNLSALDITEVTLTRSPAVGKMAEFMVLKSIETKVQNYKTAVPFRKMSDEKQQVGAYVLVPGLPDCQGDIVTAAEIEKAAHSFMRNLCFNLQKGTATGLEHQTFKNIGYPIESFFDVDGKNGVKGGWWLTTQVINKSVWNDIKAGLIIGYSIGGSGSRKKAEINLDVDVEKKQEITEEGIIKKILKKLAGVEKLEKQANTDKPKKEESTKPKVSRVLIKTEKEDNKKMELELLKKYDLQPSVVDKFEKDGMDIEKAIEGVTTFLKAIGLNLSNKGIGYTTKQLADVVRSGSFGQFPTPAVAWNPNSTVQKTEDQPEQPKNEVVEKSDEQEAEEIKKNLANLLERLEKLEGRTPARKSTDQVHQPDQPQHQEGFSAMDNIGLSLNECEKILKNEGFRV